jgi:ACS family glucarate transporter-like MFS transporter
MASAAPRVRYGVVAFSIALAVIASIDRVVLSLSRGKIAADLHLNDAQMGLVFSAYATAYAICEIPSGHLGDRSGPGPVLMRIAIWWSIFMAATGQAFNFISLYLGQLLFGAGQAGCYPNVGRMFAIWLRSASARMRAQGLVWLCSRWAGAFTPILIAVLFRYLSWRQTFATLGVLGAIWAVAFHRWFRTHDKSPALHPQLVPIKTPWRMFARSKTVWLLCAQYLALVFPWFFLITWAPTFIDERFHPSPAEGTALKVLPLFFGGLGALTAGFISTPLTRWTGSIGRTHKLIASLGFAGASAGLVLATLFHTPLPGVLAVAFSSFCNDLVMPIAWGTATEVAGNWSGTISGTMNMTGNAGGAIYGLTAGLILQSTHHNWNAVLYMGAAVYLTGVFIWAALDPVTPIEPARVRATPVRASIVTAMAVADPLLLRAVEVLGKTNKALDWLNSANHELNGLSPRELAATPEGRAQVLDILVGLEQGFPA